MEDRNYKNEYIQTFAAMETIAIRAIKAMPDFIYQVPEEARTYAVCEAALSNDAQYASAVPPDNLTEGLCILAAMRPDPQGEALKYLPEHKHTPAVVEAALIARLTKSASNKN
jgi:hypothetical protein